MEFLTLGLFCAALLLCVALGLPILWAMLAGLLLFLLYGRRKGFSWPALGRMTLSGVKTVKNMLLTFLLIGVLTALWRAAGTVAVLVCYAARLIRPSLFLLMAFLLNCLVSYLTGTSFGTAATMGVVCTTIAAAMGVSPALAGGAVLAGVFFGDRCSPLSTSALLVAEVTGTDIFSNIRRMLRSAAVPLCAACAVYAAAGFLTGGSGEAPDLTALFGREFTLHWAALLPAAVILVLSLFRVPVRIAMAASIAAALPLCLLLQSTTLAGLPSLILTGYRAADPEAAALLNGGGILSMLNVAVIVCLSACYAGIFRETGLLDGIQGAVRRLAVRTTPFTALFCTALAACAIACNQSLAILLTNQLCAEAMDSPADLALGLEDTAVVLAALIPWSIAGAVPLATVGAPTSSILFACFLYFLPLWRLITAHKRRRIPARQTE